MASSLRIPIKKEIWYWALKESQMSEEEIFKKYPQINQWITGKKNPTFKQLEKFANFLKIPFGYLFLESPPTVNVMKAEFRSINSKLPKMSKELKDTILAMDFKKNWMSEYRKSLGWSKLEVIVDFNKQKSGTIPADAAVAKKLLGLKDNWYLSVKDFREAYNFLREAVEHTGILVMQNGVVGTNNHRKLDINEFRAFLLFDSISPLIFINNNDSLGGKIFSLIHEYFHILIEKENLFLHEDLYSTKENERFINRLTAEFLMPEEQVRRHWDKNTDPLDQIHELSRVYKVSEVAVALKLKDMSLADNKIIALIVEEARKNFDKKKSKESGGDFYNTYNTRISPVFAKAVIGEAETGAISYTYAFRLLDITTGKTYNKIKERLAYHDL
ncbi:MAG: ImmA/IrrE family metallo-endopeptidase [Bacillota bacterium]